MKSRCLAVEGSVRAVSSMPFALFAGCHQFVEDIHSPQVPYVCVCAYVHIYMYTLAYVCMQVGSYASETISGVAICDFVQRKVTSWHCGGTLHVEGEGYRKIDRKLTRIL